MTRVCDIAELESLAALHQWARTHHTNVRYLGPTLEGTPVYAATRGPVTRVARGEGPTPYPQPLVWSSPLEVDR